jgi:gluconolactonase
VAWEFERVAGPFDFTEGPAWDGQVLLFTDIPKNRILRYDPITGKCEEFRTGTNEANGLIFDADGRLYGCEGGGRRVVRYNEDGSTTVVADQFEGSRLNSPNDLAFDSKGRLWFTDPRYSDDVADLELGHESVWRLDPQTDGSWEMVRVTHDTTKPNGLLVSPDGGTLYVAQSDYGDEKKRELRSYAIRADGTLGECDVLHNFYPHRGIDGMSWDSDGNIVATAGWELSGPGSMIYVFAPNGRVLETHPLEARPSNCTFGDSDLRTLYVTAGGALYRARTDRKGWLVYPAS